MGTGKIKTWKKQGKLDGWDVATWNNNKNIKQ
jgi:hypothetical protein